MPLTVTIVGLNYTPEATGNAPYTGSLAEGLQQRGWMTRVITTYPHYPSWRLPESGVGWASSSAGTGVRVDRKLHYVPRNPRGYRRLISELSFGVRSVVARWGKPDVVVLVSPGLFAAMFGVLRAKCGIRRVPVALWVQDIYTLGIEETAQGGKLTARLMHALEGRILRASDRVVAIHERSADVLMDRLHVPASKIAVVRNWTHLPEIEVVDRAATREALGWNSSDVVVLHAGNLGVKQGLENVVDAARLADERGSAVRFVLLGGGSERSRLQHAAEGIRSVEFLEALDEDRYQAAMAAADILLVNEKPGVATMAVPSKLTSYFSSGRPVIAATDAGSITESEVLTSGGGVVVPAGDPSALLEGAEALGSDLSAAERLGARGQLFRRSHLTEDAALARYAQVLTALAVRGTGSKPTPRSR
ncbi:glycosyltransferase [Curtobacterium sp. ISL-83]|uniref:glycosyltransferase n=1 Tax=Curtobacterium sp. ISL-83 TaxID=2819145 RepID=UPI0020362221|nr:glycosyltransferase [Curtobacterium sp. ISL-83]